MKKRRKRARTGGGIVCRESSAFLRSQREITVCGCQKVLHYAPESVGLRLFDGVMEISGEGLTATTYFGSEIKLSGMIKSIAFKESE